MAPSSFKGSLPPQPSVPDATFDVTESPEQNCPFCIIAATYEPYDPRFPPPTDTPSLSPAATSPGPPAFLVLSTLLLVAFLDIMPLSPGHLLVCPRTHRPKLTDVTADESRELGYYLRILSSALVRATGVADWNVVQNNGAAAAQVVPHMHYHIIPRPELAGKGTERFTSTMFGRGARQELDEEDGARLAEKVRTAVVAVLREEEERSKKAKL